MKTFFIILGVIGLILFFYSFYLKNKSEETESINEDYDEGDIDGTECYVFGWLLVLIALAYFAITQSVSDTARTISAILLVVWIMVVFVPMFIAPKQDKK